jgi:hypothetical protein
LRTNRFYIFAFAFFLIATVLQSQVATAQVSVIQFSGVVLGEDSISGVAGVHVYVPKSGRGSTSNLYGYFSMPVLAGDSVIFSSVGYQRQSYIIPSNEGDKLTVVVELIPDTTILPEIDIFPYPTEELFKKAILSLELPYQNDLDNMERNMGESLLRKMYLNEPMSASANHRYFMNMQNQQFANKFQPQQITLLNPFAWANFIKSIKRGDLKKKN